MNIAQIKFLALQEALRSGKVMVLVDPRVKGIMVPSQFLEQEVLPLTLGYDLLNPIPDLRLGPDGVTATLSFNETPFHCTLPWACINTLQEPAGDKAVCFVTGDETELVVLNALEPKEPEAPKRARPSWMKVVDGGVR